MRHILKRWSRLIPMSSERLSKWTLTGVQLKNQRYSIASWLIIQNILNVIFISEFDVLVSKLIFHFYF